jgi:hypothetical protein
MVPETQDNFFLIIQSRTEFEPPDKGLLGHHALYDPGVVTVPEPDAHLGDAPRMGSAHQGRRRDFQSLLSFQSRSTWSAGKAT